MSDLSMERLEPTPRVPESPDKQPRRDPESPPQHRAAPTKPKPESAEEAEIPSHELDQLG